jgi:hypothetical protein
MDDKQVAFLLDLLIGKTVSQSDIKDPIDSILYYRLDEITADKVLDEVSKIAGEVNGGANVTHTGALERVGFASILGCQQPWAHGGSSRMPLRSGPRTPGPK